MKTSSKILLGIAVVLVAAFGVKNVTDYEIYRKDISSAPFDLAVGVNALLLALPAAIIAAAALFSERKTRALAICAAVCAAVSVEEFVRQTTEQFRFPDALLMASPYIAATSIFAVFVMILVGRNGDKKRISRILFGISGAIAAGFVIMCIIMTIANKGRDRFFKELFRVFFFYGIFFLLPAAITAAAALYLRRNTVFLAVGAAVCAAIIALMLILQVLWIMTLPTLITAAVCMILAVLAHKKKEV